MKLIKEHINETFEEDSDPIKDLGIGKKHLIEQWLKKYDITNYVINPDFSIDVKTSVYLNRKLNGNLPEYIQFGKIEGSFYIESNNMTSLKGCPYETKSLFSCRINKLKSLKYAPIKIQIVLFCEDNSISLQELKKYANTPGINRDIIIQLNDGTNYAVKKLQNPRYTNEAFTQDSDPIHDLNIGAVNLYDKGYKLTNNKKKDKLWVNYLNFLTGKTIQGFFKYGVYYTSSENLQTEEKFFKKFVINDINSYYMVKNKIFVVDNNGISYYVCPDEYYIITDSK
jgi:hypothetical protein